MSERNACVGVHQLALGSPIPPSKLAHFSVAVSVLVPGHSQRHICPHCQALRTRVGGTPWWASLILALTRAHGPGGVRVYDCGSSKVISPAVEKALHEHFAPICDASDDKMPRLWRKRGAGYAQGIGPYHVCIRIMPLPLPHGWRRSF